MRFLNSPAPLVTLEPDCAEANPQYARIYAWTGLGNVPFRFLDHIEGVIELSRKIREIGAIGIIPKEDFPTEDPGRMDTMSTPVADVQFEMGKAYVAIFPPRPIQARRSRTLRQQQAPLLGRVHCFIESIA